jgi:hypothetical protein
MAARVRKHRAIICQRNHIELPNSSEWESLELVGIQPGEPAETINGFEYSATPALELRNCSCGTTMSKVIK